VHVLTIAALLVCPFRCLGSSATWGLGQGARLERKLDLILKHLGLGTELSVEIPARVHELAHAGRRFKPLGSCAKATMLSLKEAKDYVEGRH